MFFLVNAVDLANSEEEQRAVLAYVKGELEREGIRNPRLYGVSSHVALAEKQASAPLHQGMRAFEEAFSAFLERELRSLIANSLQAETDRLFEQLEAMRRSARENERRKPERLQELKLLPSLAESLVREVGGEAIAAEAVEELSLLLHYVKKRALSRLPDFFKEAYNPGRLTGRATAGALARAADELTERLRFDLEQELRVTALRIWLMIERGFLQQQERRRLAILEREPALAVADRPLSERPLPPFHLEWNRDWCAKSNAMFRSSSHFFTGGGRTAMQGALERQAAEEIDRLLAAQRARLEEWIGRAAREEANAAAEAFCLEVRSFADAQARALQDQALSEKWDRAYLKWERGKSDGHRMENS